MNKLDDFELIELIDIIYDKIFNLVWCSTNNKVWHRVNQEENKINFQVYKITEQVSSQIRDNINFFMK